MSEIKRITGFPPVIAEKPTALILGTMPSVESLRCDFYYGHPRNAFWHILSEVFGEPFPISIEKRRAMILEHGLALWDVAESCEREGSLDSSMHAIRMNPIEALLREYPMIRKVFLNGKTAEKLFRRAVDVSQYTVRIYTLPSTSPAYTLPYSIKADRWRAAFEEVLG